MQDRLSRITAGATGQGTNRPAPASGNLVGRTFLGKYTIIRLLGEGSMGRVYLARRRDLSGGEVVVKVMHPEVAREPKFLELFEREMGVMARFQHPHVVQLYDSGTKDPGGPCIVMEYVPGTDLEHIIQRERRLKPERVGPLLGQLCSALQAAHNEGIVHRDLKPANLMVLKPGTPEESLKVMDFGLAKLALSPHVRLEKLRGDNRDVATGTPEYMASEQARGGEVDHRADIYAVGVMLYEMLAGRLPFRKKTIEELLQAHVEEKPPSFAAVGAPADTPAGIEALIMLCMSKFPNERPNKAWDVALQYEKALGLKVLKGIEPPPDPSSKPITAVLPPVPRDPDATVHEMEAWMPEAIAVIKVKGFVDDAKGEVVESVPGKIKVRLGQHTCKYRVGAPPPPPAKKGWFAGSAPQQPQQPPKLIDMELHMQKPPGQQNLFITIMVKPARGSAIRKMSSEWANCCNSIIKDIKAYLMGK
jgi:serine/threonine-protein kinase